jgi:hypothetical protein
LCTGFYAINFNFVDSFDRITKSTSMILDDAELLRMLGSSSCQFGCMLALWDCSLFLVASLGVFRGIKYFEKRVLQSSKSVSGHLFQRAQVK